MAVGRHGCPCKGRAPSQQILLSVQKSLLAAWLSGKNVGL